MSCKLERPNGTSNKRCWWKPWYKQSLKTWTTRRSNPERLWRTVKVGEVLVCQQTNCKPPSLLNLTFRLYHESGTFILLPDPQPNIIAWIDLFKLNKILTMSSLYVVAIFWWSIFSQSQNGCFWVNLKCELLQSVVSTLFVCQMDFWSKTSKIKQYSH